jgi:tubulin polyglutamylase TTLL2
MPPESLAQISYVLVTSFRPLTIHIYRRGLARFSTSKYDPSDLDNRYCHLTNHSVNKKSPNINEVKSVIGTGCKWTLDATFEYLKKEHNFDTEMLWERYVVSE